MPHTEFRDDNGVKWPSVTQVINVVNQPWKWEWFKREVQKHGWRGWQKCEAKSKRGMRIGTDVHGLLYNMLVKHFKLANEEPFKFESGQRFWTQIGQITQAMFSWVLESGAVPVTLERHLVNNEFFYHGTLDGVFNYKDRLEVFDWKTSDSVSKDHPIQLAAYAAAWSKLHPELPPVTNGRIIRVNKKLKRPKVYDELYESLDVYFPLFLGRRINYDYMHGQGQWAEVEDHDK